MNILIVGNGFDLSHYLPTKYDHFMVAMGAIESWEEQKGEMGFDDLFGSLYEKENYFFKYTKAIYKTDEIKIAIDQIEDLKKQLKENAWYQYFSDHVREVKTWIDFEQKIEEALNEVVKFTEKLEIKFKDFGKLDISLYSLEDSNDSNKDNNISNLDFKKLEKLLLLRKNKNYGVSYSNNIGGMAVIGLRDKVIGYINNKWLKVEDKPEYGFSIEKYIYFLNISLNEFICVFNNYLIKIVSSLYPINNFNSLVLGDIENIYSFNYTDTYLKFYESEQSLEFLHGRIGEKQNIVLGISDLRLEALKNIKAYGFTKYHQKLLKNTDYRFLNEESIVGKKIDKYKNTLGRREVINILIWGHSLDSSDKDYINEIFDLNSEGWINVIVFYFNETAKFDLLANLLHILGKEKVELWMKKGWLKFELNPNIVELNNIQPVDLPKFG